MSSVSLSPGIRSILQSLQATASLAEAVQTHLATGNRINSAIDNPIAYFTSLALDNRAAGLSALLDGVAQAEQTLKAASTGLGSLVSLVQSARSLALQARQALPPQIVYAAIQQTGADDSAETIGSVTGTTDTSGAFAASVDGLQIQVGASTITVHQPSAPATEGVNAIIADINNTPGLGIHGAVTASLDQSGRYIVLTANKSDTSFQVLPTAAATALGISGATGNSTSLLQAIPGLSGTSLTVQTNGNGARTVSFGPGGAQVSTLAELQSALSSAGVTVSLTGGAITLSVDASTGTRNSLTTSGTALTALGLPAAGTVYGAPSAPTPNADRASYQTQYNNLLAQIDLLTADSGYGGINLLQGDNLTTTFNENGSSSLSIAGVSLDAAGLGLSVLSGAEFQSNPNIDDVLAKLDAALTTLRAQNSAFGSNLITLQTRQDFTSSIINTLQTGASDLVLADPNQEGATLLALETRQSLSMTALSLSAQSDHAVLRLFG